MSKTNRQQSKVTTSVRQRRVFNARTKCEAVLSIWSERRKPGEVCGELGIKWASLNSWQNQALNDQCGAEGDQKKPRREIPPTSASFQTRMATMFSRPG